MGLLIRFRRISSNKVVTQFVIHIAMMITNIGLLQDMPAIFMIRFYS